MSKNRKDYEFNHEVIRKAFLDLLSRNKRKPTLAELSQKAGVSIKTIDRHMEDLQFRPQETSLRLLTDDILVAIFQTARKGNVAAQKLWLIVMEGWNEKVVQNPNDEIAELYGLRFISDDEIHKESLASLKRIMEQEDNPKRRILVSQQIELEKKIKQIKQKLNK